jgi:membrane-associated phospholipid phosphatase
MAPLITPSQNPPVPGRVLPTLPLPSASHLWSDRVAEIVSAVFSPPVLGIAMIAIAAGATQQAAAWAWAGIPLALNVLAPILYLIWLHRRGLVSDLDVQRREERARPLLFTLASMLAAVVILWRMAAPSLLLGISIAQLLQTALALTITLRWKISMHGAASAAWLTLLIFVAGWAASPALLALPLVAWSRVHLGRHTPAQTVAGAALGSLVTWSVLMGSHLR